VNGKKRSLAQHAAKRGIFVHDANRLEVVGRQGDRQIDCRAGRRRAANVVRAFR
jgi:hypothetical protein